MRRSPSGDSLSGQSRMTRANDGRCLGHSSRVLIKSRRISSSSRGENGATFPLSCPRIASSTRFNVVDNFVLFSLFIFNSTFCPLGRQSHSQAPSQQRELSA